MGRTDINVKFSLPDCLWYLKICHKGCWNFNKFFWKDKRQQKENSYDCFLLILNYWNEYKTFVKFYPSQHLPDQSQQWRHQSNILNLFKVNSKDIKKTSVTSIFPTFFWFSHYWLCTNRCQLEKVQQNALILIILFLAVLGISSASKKICWRWVNMKICKTAFLRKEQVKLMRIAAEVATKTKNYA